MKLILLCDKIIWVIKMELPKRKSTRLKSFDYSRDGYYFVTIYAGTFEAVEDLSEGTEPILEGVIVR